jgi:esterase/lipase superfamily enzyme
VPNPTTTAGVTREPTIPTISVPPFERRQDGLVQCPTTIPSNSETDFTTLKITPLVGARLAQTRLKQYAPRNRRVLVFVHGFNNHFDDAVYQLAQIVHDSGANPAPILFIWPSRRRIFEYGYDRESTNFSRDAIEETLRRVVSHPSVGEITVMAHSMGLWLLMEILHLISIRENRVQPKIRNVILTSPDLDVDVFTTPWRDIGQPRPRLTVFVSRNDTALRVSRRLACNVDRLGQIDPKSEPYHSALANSGIDVIDLTDLTIASSLNHSKFAENPGASSSSAKDCSLVRCSWVRRPVLASASAGSPWVSGRRSGAPWASRSARRSPSSIPTRGEPMTNRSSTWTMSSVRPSNRRQINSDSQCPDSMAAVRTMAIARNDRAAAGHCRSRASVRSNAAPKA